MVAVEEESEDGEREDGRRRGVEAALADVRRQRRGKVRGRRERRRRGVVVSSEDDEVTTSDGGGWRDDADR